jgi:hypothetical protein
MIRKLSAALVAASVLTAGVAPAGANGHPHNYIQAIHKFNRLL